MSDPSREQMYALASEDSTPSAKEAKTERSEVAERQMSPDTFHGHRSPP